MSVMPKAFPIEFRRDVVAVARSTDAPMSLVARDFGISESCLARWLKMDDIEEGRRPGVSQAESAQLREANKRIRLLEQENEVLRRAAVYLGRGVNPK
jgi:transposase